MQKKLRKRYSGLSKTIYICFILGALTLLGCTSSEDSTGDSAANDATATNSEPTQTPTTESVATETESVLTDAIVTDSEPTPTPTTAPTNPCTQSGQSNIDQCAWNTFSSYLADSTWTGWSSTSDLLDPDTPGDFGSRYIPDQCDDAHNANPDLRVLAQVGKVADTVFEAGDVTSRQYTYTQPTPTPDGANATPTPSPSTDRKQGVGLSGEPVVTAAGTFLRYEILMNQTAYDWIVTQNLYDSSAWEALTGDIIFPDGSVVIKNAWTELGDLPSDRFFTEDLLVYNTKGAYAVEESCEKKTMALVGQHLVTKTNAQPAWTWATFEHFYAAPDCTAAVPKPGNANVNQSCPTAATTPSPALPSDMSTYILNALNCEGDACTNNCNVAPTPNCQDTTSSNYCVDQPPASITQACRQVPPSHYRTLAGEDQGNLSNDNYILISTQWYNSNSTGDINIAPTVRNKGNRANIHPASIPVTGSPTNPFLANTTMETYERSNCMGCHSSAVYKQASGTQISTDFMFWLTIEVPCGAHGNDPSCQAE